MLTIDFSIYEEYFRLLAILGVLFGMIDYRSLFIVGSFVPKTNQINKSI